MIIWRYNNSGVEWLYCVECLTIMVLNCYDMCEICDCEVIDVEGSYCLVGITKYVNLIGWLMVVIHLMTLIRNYCG